MVRMMKRTVRYGPTQRLKKVGSVVLPLLIINVIVYIIQVVGAGGNLLITDGPVTEMLSVKAGDALRAPWTLFTSMFAHLNLIHIALNMWILFLFGPLVEQRIGSKRFLAVYLVSGLLASFASSFFYFSAAGASGALMGVLGMAIMLMPDMKVFMIPIPFPITLRTAGIIIAAMDILGVLPGVAHAAHLAGLSVGLIYGYKLTREKKKFSKKFSSKTQLDEDDMEEYLKSGRI